MMNPFCSRLSRGFFGHTLFGAAVTSLLSAQLFGAGVAVFKEQSYHLDERASIVVYKRFIETPGAPFVKVDTGKTELTVDRDKYVARVDILDSVPESIRTDAEAVPLRKAVAELDAFAAKYTKTRPVLQPYITAFSAHLAKFDAGQIRHNGNWITKEAFASIEEGNRQRRESEMKRGEEIAELNRANRERTAAFEREQRAKGLEKYGDDWYTLAEVEKFRKRDAEVDAAARAIADKSIADGVFSVLQVAEDGMLIELLSGRMRQGGINTDVAMLLGAAKGMAADGDRYKNHLFWCGTYTFNTTRGGNRTVNAYSLSKEDAIARIRTTMNGGSSKTATASSEESSAAKSKQDQVLAGAGATGSGFFVGDQGYFVTNAHVVEDSSKYEIYYQGVAIEAKLITVNKVSDLALLKIEKPVNGISLAPNEAEIGQDTFAIGYPQPGLQGLDVKVTKGVISGTKGLDDDSTRFQIDAAVQPGNSGGPLCNAAGQLVGVIVAGLDQFAVARMTGTIPQNVNYAIKASEVAALLRSKSVRAEVPSGAPKTVKEASAATGLVIVR